MSEKGQIGKCHLTSEMNWGDKIDKLTVVMSKLVVKDSHERKPLCCKYIKLGDTIDLMVKEGTRPG